MSRTLWVAAWGLVAMAGVSAGRFLTSGPLTETVHAAEPAQPAPLTLDQLVSGQLKIVDLGWSLNDTSPYWPAENYEPFRLKTIATIEKNGVLSKAFYTPEHLGTHLDAPNHFEKNQPAVEKIDPAHLFAHGVKIDISHQSDMDADYRLTVADVTRWEAEHGRIPNGAVVLVYTGWSQHWTNYPRYKNQDPQGKMHFPGYSAEAAKFLVTERHAKGIGIDTLSIDHGPSTDFIVHHIVNGAGRYGLENLARLNDLPDRGFYVVSAPIKIETGSGGPARVFAILPP
ncbi:MAG: cyclase family protein [Planctomycetes bacterium]|nr:cyclase family protein [Planctomycetota bacterium]